ncbi:MAG: hypothetical protein ACI808_002753, partial [Paraglaciecola sp.]
VQASATKSFREQVYRDIHQNKMQKNVIPSIRYHGCPVNSVNLNFQTIAANKFYNSTSIYTQNHWDCMAAANK